MYVEKCLNFLILLNFEQILDNSSYLIILEDILETLPIKDIENLFSIIEENLKSKDPVKKEIILLFFFRQHLMIKGS